MTPHTGKHKYNWEHYIKLSEGLVSGPDESQWRCSISRAYYGVFCIARNQVGCKDEKHQRGVHKKVITRLKKRTLNMGLTLEELKKFREQADYKEHEKITQAVAQDKVDKARILLNDILKLYGRNY